jgi:hypothetical protein
MAWWPLTKRINFSTPIFQRKTAAVTTDHWSLTDENGTCGIKALDSARLDSAGGYTFPCVAIMSKPDSFCRVFVSLIGLDSTRLDSVGGYAPLRDATTVSYGMIRCLMGCDAVLWDDTLPYGM